MEVPAPDMHHLRAAVGWLELGNAAESLAELNLMELASQAHPNALETRWLALARQENWDAAVPVAQALIMAAPDRAAGWLHHAYALRRTSDGGVLAAFHALSPAAAKFPQEPTIPYNLACYTCQLRRETKETLAWLRRAIKAGRRDEILAMALADPDLEPVRGEIVKLKLRH